MTKIDIFSGFLGAGKTTLIKKLMQEAYAGEKLVLIENEFGEIGIDGGFLQDAGVEITEMNSGCICCSLVGDFGEALNRVLTQFHPDRILIEPSGVGKLSDVIQAVQNLHAEDLKLNAFVTVADANKCKLYMKNFGEFYNNQIEHAAAIVLSRTEGMSEDKLLQCVTLLRTHNATAPIITTPWTELTGKQILDAMENKETLAEELERLSAETACPVCGEHHHHDHEDCCEHEHHHHEDCCEHEHQHHDHEDCCEHEHQHHDHEDCCEHEHHHHDHEDCCEHEHHDHDHEDCCEHEHHDHDHEDCCEHEHHHHDHEDCCEHEHHHHDHACACGCGHDHAADEIFTSWGIETPRAYTEKEVTNALHALEQETVYGMILRAKGIVACAEGGWLHFDYVPGEVEVRNGSPAVTGRLCVIGSDLREEALQTLFQLA